MTRKLVYRPLAEVVKNPANPKAHDTALLDTSIGRFGFVEPVVEDGRTGRLIAGHGRMETLALMERRGDAPPEGVRKSKDGGWLAPVIVGWSSRTDAEANAALIALNRTSEIGGWVDAELLALLDDLAELPEGLDGIGYTDRDIDILRKLAELEVDPSGNDPDREFREAGIDDYDNDDLQPEYQVRVSFLSRDDYEEFREKLGLEGPRRNRIWYPEQPDLIESGDELVVTEN